MIIALEISDRAGERRANRNLDHACKSLVGIEYMKKIKIAIDIRDQAAEGRTYESLGNAYDSLGVWSFPGQFIRPSSFSFLYVYNLSVGDQTIEIEPTLKILGITLHKHCLPNCMLKLGLTRHIPKFLRYFRIKRVLPTDEK